MKCYVMKCELSFFVVSLPFGLLRSTINMYSSASSIASSNLHSCLPGFCNYISWASSTLATHSPGRPAESLLTTLYSTTHVAKRYVCPIHFRVHVCALNRDSCRFIQGEDGFYYCTFSGLRAGAEIDQSSLRTNLRGPGPVQETNWLEEAMEGNSCIRRVDTRVISYGNKCVFAELIEDYLAQQQVTPSLLSGAISDAAAKSAEVPREDMFSCISKSHSLQLFLQKLVKSTLACYRDAVIDIVERHLTSEAFLGLALIFLETVHRIVTYHIGALVLQNPTRLGKRKRTQLRQYMRKGVGTEASIIPHADIPAGLHVHLSKINNFSNKVSLVSGNLFAEHLRTEKRRRRVEQDEKTRREPELPETETRDNSPLRRAEPLHRR